MIKSKAHGLNEHDLNAVEARKPSADYYSEPGVLV